MRGLANGLPGARRSLPAVVAVAVLAVAGGCDARQPQATPTSAAPSSGSTAVA
ncbi:MAG: hypothetical protein HKP61_17905, partial [Dactylosporangium sp.]|nr:hypothetical protein [Dactylosporangium sp.]